MTGRATVDPPQRDPAWTGRVGWVLATLVITWPLLVATEFKPWVLVDERSLGPTLGFLAAFVPPRLAPDFLALVARETWRTVAIATAGITMALVIAVPLALLATRALSISALSGHVLTRTMGSWVLLAEVLTTAEIEPDAGPHADFCGTCTACLDACPTRAIVAPGVVDARACIAYWTIEHRGPIPAERHEGIGDWIFGCDVCQEVCPRNRSFGAARADDLLEPRDDLRELDPAEIEGLDEAAFRARYSGTPLMRAKWEGLRRNAEVVLRNRRGTTPTRP